MLRTQSLQSQIISFIRGYIEQNKLSNGDRLPSQNELSAMMNVSVVSVREAIKTLEAKDVLTVKNGKGVFVKSAASSDYLLSAQISLKKEKESFLDLIQVRKALEKEILAKLIKRASDGEIKKIGEVTAELMANYNAGMAQNAQDRQFHYLIYEYCHSDVLKKIISSIYDLLIMFQEYPLGMDDPFTETIPLHEELYFAIRDRKTKKAQSVNTKILNAMTDDISRM